MDATKLEALRRRYRDGGEDEIADPDFAKAASLGFSGRGRRPLPYSGVSTFLDLPYRPDALHDAHGLADLDVALVGVPMDLGVTNRAGSRLGPRAVRAIERIGPYEHVLRMTPAAEVRAADIGDVPFRTRYSLESCHQDIEAALDTVVKAGVIPLAVGGDHSISQSILASVGRGRPVGMVHIDAHCDTGGVLEGSKFHHGGPFRQAVLDGVLDPERTIQIGIRGGAEYLWEFSYESGMTVIHAEEVAEMGVAAVVARAKAVVGDGPTYVSFDIDSVDPGFAPGTGTPEVGGLAPREVLAILRGLKGIALVGGDVVEVAPQYDATSNTAHCAAQVLFELLCLAAASKH
jgi:guanidinopropionase